MRVRILASLSIALLATVLLIAAVFAQSTGPIVVTHHSVPVTLQIMAPGGQPITVTLVLDVEASPGVDTSDPAVKIKVTTKRTVPSEGASVTAVTIGDISSANAVATPTAAAAPISLFPTPTPGAQTAVNKTVVALNVIEAANLRQGPGTTFDIAGQRATGTSLAIVGRNQAADWLQLEDGTWIVAALVEQAPADLPVTEPSASATLAAGTPAPVTQTAPVSQTAVALNVIDAANLRKGPGTTFDIAGRALIGTPVSVVGRNQAADWLQLADGSWIAAFLVEKVPADLPVIETAAPVPVTPVP